MPQFTNMPNFYFYLFFIASIISSIFLDLWLVKGNITFKQAIKQFFLWVAMASIFVLLLFKYKSSDIALKFVAGYVMEISLSIDNVFVFILIFNFYKVKDMYMRNLLLIGILLAIVLRIIFISAGLEIIDHFAWILYIFGPFLLYTGVKIFTQKKMHAEIKESRLIKYVKKNFRFTDTEHNGKYIKKINRKYYFTELTLIAFFLAVTDFIFAMDSIPTIISLVRSEGVKTPFTSDEILVVYSSNIFALLGLRALFVILQKMANKFSYLQKSIGLILMFIGLKMLIVFFEIHISVIISLAIIIMLLMGGIVYSIYKTRVKK